MRLLPVEAPSRSRAASSLLASLDDGRRRWREEGKRSSSWRLVVGGLGPAMVVDRLALASAEEQVLQVHHYLDLAEAGVQEVSLGKMDRFRLALRHARATPRLHTETSLRHHIGQEKRKRSPRLEGNKAKGQSRCTLSERIDRCEDDEDAEASSPPASSRRTTRYGRRPTATVQTPLSRPRPPLQGSFMACLQWYLAFGFGNDERCGTE